MSNEVGLRLKELRRKLNMTQPQLGEKLGIIDFQQGVKQNCLLPD
jgi:transcriptional regulator with XRE-family HTH domain